MKLPVYVFAFKYDWTDEINYAANSNSTAYDASGILVAETEIEIPEPPRADVINGTVKHLRVIQQKLRTECEVKVNEIDHQIGKLLAIEDKP